MAGSLKWSGSFFNIVIFFIESSSVNKKNEIIKLFEPYERRNMFFVAWKAREGLVKRLARVYSL